MSYTGTVYAQTPDDPLYVLSLDELTTMCPQLVGLPVRVEHQVGELRSPRTPSRGHAVPPFNPWR